MTIAHPEASEPVLREMPDGMLEYDAQVAVRNLVRRFGFEHARELIAIYLVDEMERKPQ